MDRRAVRKVSSVSVGSEERSNNGVIFAQLYSLAQHDSASKKVVQPILATILLLKMAVTID